MSLRLDARRNVVRGQRFEPTLNAAGGIIRQVTQLLRAEDPTGLVNLWQVNLSPAFRKATGPNSEGQPARFAPITGAGIYFANMTWGGGGVGYRTTFPWPDNGASFAVAGDNVMLEIFSLDIVNVYTEENKPCIQAWVTPSANPTSPSPIGEIFAFAFPGVSQSVLRPWTRRVTVTKDTLAATVAVQFDLATVAQLTAAESWLTIPVPARAQTITLLPSAGNAFAHTEMVFT